MNTKPKMKIMRSVPSGKSPTRTLDGLRRRVKNSKSPMFLTGTTLIHGRSGKELWLIVLLLLLHTMSYLLVGWILFRVIISESPVYFQIHLGMAAGIISVIGLFLSNMILTRISKSN